MTEPSESSKGPPLFPGFMEASVWITSWMGRPPNPLLISLPVPLMMPECSTEFGCHKGDNVVQIKTLLHTTIANAYSGVFERASQLNKLFLPPTTVLVILSR